MRRLVFAGPGIRTKMPSPPDCSSVRTPHTRCLLVGKNARLQVADYPARVKIIPLLGRIASVLGGLSRQPWGCAGRWIAVPIWTCRNSALARLLSSMLISICGREGRYLYSRSLPPIVAACGSHAVLGGSRAGRPCAACRWHDDGLPRAAPDQMRAHPGLTVSARSGTPLRCVPYYERRDRGPQTDSSSSSSRISSSSTSMPSLRRFCRSRCALSPGMRISVWPPAFLEAFILSITSVTPFR